MLPYSFADETFLYQNYNIPASVKRRAWVRGYLNKRMLMAGFCFPLQLII